MTLDLQVSKAVRIQSVQEQKWLDVALEFILHQVSQEEFKTTAAWCDPRFVNQENGLLLMSFHSLVVSTPGGNVLIDTCIGNDKDRPLIPAWHQQSFPYLQRLADINLQPADIDFVCCTHFHADHVGWNTRLENGTWVPTFPNARYLFAEPEVRYWEQVHKENPQHIFTQSWNDSVLPVIEAQQADIVSPDYEILDGIRLQPAFGHSPGNVVVAVEADGERAILSGDVMHHPVQIERPDWASVFDQDRDQARVTRKQLLHSIADDRTHLIGAHFAGPVALRVTEKNGVFSYR